MALDLDVRQRELDLVVDAPRADEHGVEERKTMDKQQD